MVNYLPFNGGFIWMGDPPKSPCVTILDWSNFKWFGVLPFQEPPTQHSSWKLVFLEERVSSLPTPFLAGSMLVGWMVMKLTSLGKVYIYITQTYSNCVVSCRLTQHVTVLFLQHSITHQIFNLSIPPSKLSRPLVVTCRNPAVQRPQMMAFLVKKRMGKWLKNHDILGKMWKSQLS